MFGRLIRGISRMSIVEGLTNSNKHVLGLPVIRSSIPSLVKVCSKYASSVPQHKITEGIPVDDEKALLVTKDTLNKVNQQIKAGEEGRLFAIIHVCGKQFKVTPEDIIILEGYWPPKNGDEVVMEKVLLAGGSDFTLIGRPVLPRGLVHVKATVIEKDLSHTKPVFFKRRRKQYMRINFYRAQRTMLRINEIKIAQEVGGPRTDVEQYDRTM